MASFILFPSTWNPVVHGVIHIQDVILLEVKQEGLAGIRNPDFGRNRFFLHTGLRIRKYFFRILIHVAVIQLSDPDPGGQ
jgi:hypothetical protein